MAQMMTPNDANYLGKVFGGAILALIDLTASATASRFCGMTCVTASFDRVDFLKPVEIGELVELDGVVTYVGRTSIEVTIQVHATDLREAQRQHVNTARVTMVALQDGKPAQVPRLICESREDKLRFLEGRLRREIRAERVKEMESWYKKIEDSHDQELDRLLSSVESLRLAFTDENPA
jgi:acyl-CoA hydrolase